jgi:hypothetical protein
MRIYHDPALHAPQPGGSRRGDRLLERPSGEQSCGDILATGSPLQK